MIRFGSVCSGIEAASVAWNPLGWKAAWLAEIEPFPSAVLAHHYPDVPNLGDMTTLPGRIATGDVEAPDVFCGGTPCQAFSVAGLRKSLDDARGNLSLTFCEIANAIDTRRAARGQQPAIVFWENVPGVLSTSDNAFGCFLAGLAGEDDPLVPPGGKWTNAGCVFGPQRAVAWRVLDAQYFGVAQRRRRVFVVASARKGFDPATVLFEFDGMRRDSAPSREARQTAPAIPARSAAGGGLGTDFDCDGGVITMAHGQGGAEIGFDRGPTLTCNHEAPIAAYPVGVTIHGTDPTVQKVASLDETAQCLRARTPGNIDNSSTTVVMQPVSFAIQAGALRTNPSSGPDGIGVQADHAYTLEARAEVQAVCFDTTQITSKANYSNPRPGDPCHPLAAGAHAPSIAYAVRTANTSANGHGIATEVTHTLDQAQGQCIAFPANLSATQCASTEHLSPALGAKNPTAVAFGISNQPTPKFAKELAPSLDAKTSGGGRMEAVAYTTSLDANSPPPAVVFQQTADCLTAAYGTKWNGNASADNGSLFASHAMQVRRLTPVECERLQGFPDGYTDIPWTEYQRIQKRAAKAGTSFEAELRKHGKVLRGPGMPACPDGPRYKALGNSWAVPNVRWIGARINAWLEAEYAREFFSTWNVKK